jgi:hypothetical protein
MSATEVDALVEWWLRKEVVQVYDAMLADPGRAIPVDQVVAALRAHHANRSKQAESVS